ncbi:hypothetical protein EBT31_23425 [bacterium]|nr:hypothetical protein [bacterium]
MRRATQRCAHIDGGGVGTASKLARFARDLEAFDGTLPPADVPVTVVLAATTRARDIHKAIRSSRATSKCLDGPLQGTALTTPYYFSGVDSRVGACVVVMGRAMGRPPRLQQIDEFAAVEKALLTLWILGFAATTATKSDVVFDRRTGTVTLVDCSRVVPVHATWRRSKAANTLSVSRTTRLFSEWDPPAWLTPPATAGLENLATARETAWSALVPCG